MGNVRRMSAMCVLVLIALAACSSTKSSSGTATTTTAAARSTTTAVPTKPLRVLVTNDDGVAAPGIDAIVEALRKQPQTTVTVIAPAENQSGAGSRTTGGTLTAVETTTAGGYPAKAVKGTPADTIVYAFDQHGIATRPDLVVSGINFGQNLGTSIDISGTVGAARAAAQHGVPALAVSQGLAASPDKADYASGARAALDWIAKHRDALRTATLTNLNIPTCPSGKPRRVVVVPVAASGNGIGDVDCVAPYPSPASDVQAFLHGYITETDNLPLRATR
jgi:5'-nucleotidase